MKITQHAYDRAKERIGIPDRATERIAPRAFQEGIGIADAKGTLRSYLAYTYAKYKTARNIRIWGEKVWIFNDEQLITVYALPRIYRRSAQKLLERKREAEVIGA
jgi:hypothetical protein